MFKKYLSYFKSKSLIIVMIITSLFFGVILFCENLKHNNVLYPSLSFLNKNDICFVAFREEGIKLSFDLGIIPRVTTNESASKKQTEMARKSPNNTLLYYYEQLDEHKLYHNIIIPKEKVFDYEKFGLSIDSRIEDYIETKYPIDDKTAFISSSMLDYYLINGIKNDDTRTFISEPKDIINKEINGKIVKGVYESQWDRILRSLENGETKYSNFRYIYESDTVQFYNMFSNDDSSISLTYGAYMFVGRLTGITLFDYFKYSKYNFYEINQYLYRHRLSVDSSIMSAFAPESLLYFNIIYIGLSFISLLYLGLLLSFKYKKKSFSIMIKNAEYSKKDFWIISLITSLIIYAMSSFVKIVISLVYYYINQSVMFPYTWWLIISFIHVFVFVTLCSSSTYEHFKKKCNSIKDSDE